MKHINAQSRIIKPSRKTALDLTRHAPQKSVGIRILKRFVGWVQTSFKLWEPAKISERLLLQPSIRTKEAYKNEMANASPDRLAHLIKVCGFLTQTKVYLSGQKKEGVEGFRLFWRVVSLLCCLQDWRKATKNSVAEGNVSQKPA